MFIISDQYTYRDYVFQFHKVDCNKYKDTLFYVNTFVVIVIFGILIFTQSTLWCMQL